MISLPNKRRPTLPSETKMSIDSRYEYLQQMQTLYRQATKRTEKSQLLNAMEAATGYHRKYLIQKINEERIQRHARQRERGNTYGPDVDAALRLIWKAHDYICPERLSNATLLRTAHALARDGELALPPSLKAQLGDISASTIRYHLPDPPFYKQAQRRQRRRQNLLQRHIPAKRIPWNIEEPGHFEVDLVHHCGPETRGEYVYTLQMIDVATTWSARRAILGRSYVVVVDIFLTLFAQIPFPILELHPDNGGEFLNDHLIHFLETYHPDILLSRTHRGRSNDNRYVELKNRTLVRVYLGRERLDTVKQTRYLNRIYELMGRYYNYLQPVLHLVSKEYQPATAERPVTVRRKYDEPRPPLDRLCQDQAEADLCAPLRETQAALNPLTLRQQIYDALEHLWTYPPADPQHPEDVYQTLAHPERFPAACAALDLTPVAPLNLAPDSETGAPPVYSARYAGGGCRVE